MASFTLSQLLEPLAGILSTDLTLSGFVALGTTPSLTGTLRLPYTGTINWRNANNTGDLPALDFTGAAGAERLLVGFGDIFEVSLSATSAVTCIANYDVTGDQTLSGFLALGASPALTGSLRLSNVDSIVMRSVGAADMNILSTPNSDEFDFLDSIMPVVRIAAAAAEFAGRIEVNRTSGAALSITDTAGTFVAFQVNTSVATENVRIGSATSVTPLTLEAASGAQAVHRSATTTVLTPSGASATAASFIPAGALVLAITARVITAITGPAGFDLGDGVIVDRWGNSILTALGTTVDVTDYTSSALQLYPAANDVVITSDGVDFTGGEVRLIVNYIDFTAPTS